MNILTTSGPNSDNACKAPYKEDNGILSPWFRALVNILVILVWILFVLVLKFLQICAMSRDAKSLKAQWLSYSSLTHSCFETIHVVTAGINSCNWKFHLSHIYSHINNFCKKKYLHIFLKTMIDCLTMLWPFAWDI